MAETLLLIHLDEVLHPGHNLKNQHLFGDSTRRIIPKRNALPVHGILEPLEPCFQAHRLTHGAGNLSLPPPPNRLTPAAHAGLEPGLITRR